MGKVTLFLQSLVLTGCWKNQEMKERIWLNRVCIENLKCYLCLLKLLECHWIFFSFNFRRLSISPQVPSIAPSSATTPSPGAKSTGKTTPVAENQDGSSKLENIARQLQTEQKKAQKKTPIWQRVAAEKAEVYEVPVAKR